MIPWKCKNCFTWSDIVPCEECGAPQPEENLTEEEIADAVFDRLRGSPKKLLRQTAAECQLSYDDFINALVVYIETDGDAQIHLNVDSPDDMRGIWDAFELVMNRVVPERLRYSPFTCAC